MQEILLPLFPLGVVLLPSAPLPLHIFEERYKQMISEVLIGQGEFGVVQASEKGILSVGCTASIEKVITRYEDGRLDILTVGRRRFEIQMLDESKPYLRAAVTILEDADDAEPPPNTLVSMTIAGLRMLKSSDADSPEVPSAEDPQFSFKAAQFIPDLPFRQTMLSLRSEADRVKHLVAYLPEYLVKLKRANYIRQLAPRNGHGLKLGGDDIE
jgi:Lon protease-like protein